MPPAPDPTSSTGARSYIAEYHHTGIISPIDYAALGFPNEQALTGLYEAGFQGARFGDKLFGIPSEVSNYACYSNNTIWQAAKLDPMKDFPKTWDDLTKIAETLTQRDKSGAPIRRGYDYDWSNGNIYYLTLSTMMHQLGVDVIDETTGRANLDTDAARHVVQYYADWVRKLRLGGPQYVESRIAFLGGKMGSEGSFGVWGIPQMNAAKIDFSVSPAPRWPARRERGFRRLCLLHDGQRPLTVAGPAGSVENGTNLHGPRSGPVRSRRPVCPAQGRPGDAGLQVQPMGTAIPERAEAGEVLTAHRRLRPGGCRPCRGATRFLKRVSPVGPVLKDLNAQVNAIIQQEMKS